MNQPRDPNLTANTHDSSASSDSLGPGLAAAFGQATEAPRSSFGGGLKPVVLPDAAGESSHIVKTQSDALPKAAQAGDRYQLSGEIARGGMGAVLRGRDVDLGRDLAIKVLLEKHAQRPEIARRFLEEAQIGGQLQHPGVVPVYDIGRFGELLFFTMKLVKGKTLAEVLAERKDLTSDRPRLLGISLQVSQTLAYAHAKGVIHRDLKPANIMVGSFGEVQVMDWGLAKVLASGGVADEEKASRLHQEAKDETNIKTARSAGSNGSFGTDTEAGSLLGTPAYMPPEQANGDVTLMDRRADVFGLGAILCEILTGKPPYVGRSQEEVRRKAANGDLADAYSRLDSSGADKDLITLTRLCLSPEPMDRPKDAQAVAESLSGYLDGVQERLRTAERERAVAVVRVAEENKRRRVQLALAGAVTVLLLGAGSFAWWRSEQAQVARERGARNGEAVSALLGQAEETLKQGNAAKAAIALDAARKRAAEGGAENEADRLKLLVADLALLRELDAVDQFRWTWTENQFPGWKGSTIRLGETLKRFGLDPEVNPVSELAVRVNESLLRERLIAALDKVMLLKSSANTRALLQQVDPDGYRDALRDAFVKADTAKIIAMVKKKEAMDQPSGFIAFLGEFDGVPRERKRQLLEAALARQPGNLGLLMQLGLICSAGPNKGIDERLRWYQAAVATAPDNYAAHINLGVALGEKGQIDESIACYQRANTINPNNSAGFHNLGVKLKEKGQVDEAISCFRKAIANNPGFADSYCSLADALKEKGQWDSAIESYRNSISLNPDKANTHNNLGVIFMEMGELDEAMDCFRKAIAADPNYGPAYNNLGGWFLKKNQIDDGIAKFQKAIEINPSDRGYFRNLGLAFLKKGDSDQAITSFRKIIEIDPLDAAAYNSLANALKSKGQLNEAIASYENAINLDPKNASYYHNLGIAQEKNGQTHAAISSLRKSIEFKPSQEAYNRLGLLLARIGQYDEAVESYKKAVDFCPKSAAIAYLNLGNTQRARKLPEDAIRCYQKAMELDPKYATPHSGLGVALAETGRFEEAIQSHQKAIDLNPGEPIFRQNLACGLALAAAGKPEKGRIRDEKERSTLRHQALNALREAKDLWSKQLEKSASRSTAKAALQQIQTDPDLASLRDPEALKKLPPEEQKAFSRFWAEVDSLLKQVSSAPSREIKP